MKPRRLLSVEGGHRGAKEAAKKKNHTNTNTAKGSGCRGAGFNHLTIIASKDGQVVAWGFNGLCSGPQASVHSEVTALRALFSRRRHHHHHRHNMKKAGRTGGPGNNGNGSGKRSRDSHGGNKSNRNHHHHHHRSTRGGSRSEQGSFDLVNVRFTFSSLRLSRPCRRCWLFLSKHLWRFRRVMYTTSEGAVVCMSADEFAAVDPPDHVSKGHRLAYYKKR